MCEPREIWLAGFVSTYDREPAKPQEPELLSPGDSNAKLSHPTEPGTTMTTGANIAIWICMAALLALVIGIGTGTLAFLGGTNAAHSTIRGGVAFGGTLTLAIVVLNTLNVL